MKHRRAIFAAALLALSTIPGSGQEKTPAAADETKPEEKAATPGGDAEGHVVKTGPFEIAVELDALFTAGREHRISLTPREWADMTVLSVVAPGARVKKGDKLITLDTEKLEKAIAEAELGEPAARLALRVAEAELASLEKLTPMQLEAARRTRRIAEEDWAHYQKVGHIEALRAAERSLDFTQQSFDYAKEEYEQLKKMYEADDLTEETEEIILKRAKNNFDRATESLRLAKMRVDRDLKVNIPRQRVAQKAAVESGEISYKAAVVNLPRTLESKRHEAAKMKRERAKAIDKLRGMKADLAAFDVRAPADGIVYYGMSKGGKWLTAPAVAKKLIPGGKLAPREVVLTVTETDRLGLVATVPEEKLGHVRPGITGKAVPVSNPSLELPAKVRQVNYVPGAFTADLATDTGDAKHLYPGMKAKVKLSVAKFDKAVTIPTKLLDGDRVWVKKDGEKVARKVRTGPSDGKVTVIFGGLKEGDTVVAK